LAISPHAAAFLVILVPKPTTILVGCPGGNCGATALLRLLAVPTAIVTFFRNMTKLLIGAGHGLTGLMATGAEKSMT